MNRGSACDSVSGTRVTDRTRVGGRLLPRIEEGEGESAGSVEMRGPSGSHGCDALILNYVGCGLGR